MPYRVQDVPTESDLTPNVSSAKVEKVSPNILSDTQNNTHMGTANPDTHLTLTDTHGQAASRHSVLHGLAHQDPGVVTNAVPPSLGTKVVACTQSHVASTHRDEDHTHTCIHTWATLGPAWK